MKLTVRAMAAGASALLSALPAMAGTTIYNAVLTGIAEAPPNASPGTGFAIVVEGPAVVADLDPHWADLARIVEVPTSSMPMTLPPGGAVIVRPDRYVAAVCHDATELAAATDALLDHLLPTERPST